MQMQRTVVMAGLLLWVGACGSDDAKCGDGKRTGSEVCDGTVLPKSCEDLGFTGGTIACSSSCDAFDTSQCTGGSGNCNNGTLDSDEVCDGTDFGGKTCQSEGFAGGSLTCNGCTSIDTSSCVSAGWKAVSAGGDFTCAIDSQDQVWCWGAGEAGQLGHGSAVNSQSTPVKVLLSTAAAQLSVGWAHACAVDSAGQAWCWGSSDNGQLGYDAAGGDSTHTPVKVFGFDDALEIAAGAAHSCAIKKTDQTLWCWGLNAAEVGLLGDGTDVDKFTPNQVPGQTSIATVSAGPWHSCAVTARGGVSCWGDNPDGQIGDGTSGDVVDSPAVVTGLSNVAQLSVGEDHTCAVDSDMALWCWGYNSVGQLGTGDTESKDVPFKVTAVSDTVQVSTGISYSCALDSQGQARCWGENSDGQLGAAGAASMTPVVVSGGHAFDQIECGERHCCGISAGALFCWGANDVGQLGDGTTTGSATPVQIAVPSA